MMSYPALMTADDDLPPGPGQGFRWPTGHLVGEVTGRRLTVRVEHSTQVDQHGRDLPAYLVTVVGGAYRAILRPCWRDDCWTGRIIPCAIPVSEATGRHADRDGAGWRAHDREHCHGWHDGRVMALAAAVLTSERPYRPRRLPRRAPIEHPGQMITGGERPPVWGEPRHDAAEVASWHQVVTT